MTAGPGEANAACRGTALVVDDDAVNRRLLRALLARQGFRSFDAENGRQALEIFASEAVDLVFMDVMMPVMDGYEATRRIKAMSGDDFVPVIFLTALQDPASLARCTEAGGDDFLSKPFDFAILDARVRAMERIRALHRRLASQHEVIVEARERDRLEQELADRIFRRVVSARNLSTDRVRILQRAADTFCGDLVLVARLPDGSLRVLLGDFTGHGLTASIGALPVTEIFHGMTAQGATDLELLEEINRRLHDVLPADRFMAACLATVSSSEPVLSFWNGGMPAAFLGAGQQLRRLPSRGLPLGILPNLSRDNAIVQVAVHSGERLLMVSDGLTEAEDAEAQMFGEACLERVFALASSESNVMPGVIEALDRHCDGIPQRDDITAVELSMVTPQPSAPVWRPFRPHVRKLTDGWCWSVHWSNRHLPETPNLGESLAAMGLLEGLESQQPVLEFIVNELYANALEHGVLRLCSSMKTSPDGFDAYYAERARRLAEGVEGWIALEICYQSMAQGGRLLVRLSDSGPGFEPSGLEAPEDALTRPWGRGIPLVTSMCEELRYLGDGSSVEAVCRWG